MCSCGGGYEILLEGSVSGAPSEAGMEDVGLMSDEVVSDLFTVECRKTLHYPR
jgi:hypothetical protein